MSKVADEYEEIARRLKELEADNAIGWSVCDLYGYYVGYNYQNQYQSAVSSGSLNNGSLNSLAHPGWPYAGTGHEWRGFTGVPWITSVTLTADQLPPYTPRVTKSAHEWTADFEELGNG